MGTSNAYSGGGGAAGGKLRREIDDWLDSLPDSPPNSETPDGTQPGLPVDALLNVIPMLRPRSGGTADGPGGGGVGGGGGGSSAGGGAGGALRSARASATTAGRAAAAAYALRTGDADTLSRLGLDLEALRSNPDGLDVTRQIVDMACQGAISDGTIEAEEQRYVAVEVAQWVLEENAGGSAPSPEDIVRKSIAVIIAEAAQSETVEMVRRGEKPEWSREVERQLREAAEVLAERVEIPSTGLTEDAFSQAVEDGIETLRRMRRAR